MPENVYAVYMQYWGGRIKYSITPFEQRGFEVSVKPCRDSDSDSNPDSGASFLPSFDEREDNSEFV
jgi:hypothetical protein